jgi:hypothetical protein
MYEMVNIFEVFLPQLLRYPNPTDPLNGEAAALMMREPKTYEAKVKGKQRCMYLTRATRLIAVRIRFKVRIERSRRRCGRRLGRR